jgi:hypothetical protein
MIEHFSLRNNDYYGYLSPSQHQQAGSIEFYFLRNAKETQSATYHGSTASPRTFKTTAGLQTYFMIIKLHMSINL